MILKIELFKNHKTKVWRAVFTYCAKIHITYGKTPMCALIKMALWIDRNYL